MAESQEKDVPRERDLPRVEDLPGVGDLPRIDDLPAIELPLVGDPRAASDPAPGTRPAARDVEIVRGTEDLVAREPDPPSLNDEIFAIASAVEVEDASRPEPLLRLWDGPVRAPSRGDAGRAAAGFLTFVFVDVVMMYAPLMSSDRPSLLPQAVALLVLAFGLGGLLAWKVGEAWRPFGYGMMLGWVFLTLVSVGLLTGVSP